MTGDTLLEHYLATIGVDDLALLPLAAEGRAAGTYMCTDCATIHLSNWQDGVLYADRYAPTTGTRHGCAACEQIAAHYPSEPPAAQERHNRITWNRPPDDQDAGGDIDELVIHQPDLIHIEQMNADTWWIGIYTGGPDDPYWTGNVTVDAAGHPHFAEQEDTGVLTGKQQ